MVIAPAVAKWTTPELKRETKHLSSVPAWLEGQQLHCSSVLWPRREVGSCNSQKKPQLSSSHGALYVSYLLLEVFFTQLFYQ